MIILFITHAPVLAQLNMVETHELRLVTYDFGHQYILPHAARCFDQALHFHQKIFDYQPSEKITILTQDFGDFGNGGATAIPRNAISMGLSPFSYTFETSPAGERMFSMMNHELVHVVALDNASQSDRFFHSFFRGKVLPTKEDPVSAYYSYLTSPRRYSPRWYHEGIASYVETWMSGGIGLAMGSYDEMVFRTRVLENAPIYSAQGLEAEGTTTDFQGKTNSYLYGTRFMGYLSWQYGPDKIIAWVKRKTGSKRSYSAQFNHVFGKSLNRGWDDWIAFEKEWQQKNIAQLQENPVTEVTPISDRTLGSVSYPFYDPKRNRVYVAVNYPGQVPHLAALYLEDGRVEKLADIKGAALFYVSSLAYDEGNDLLFFTTDNDAWRDLQVYDIRTAKVRKMQRDFRTGDLALNKTDLSLWGVKHLNGFSTLVRIPKDDDGDTATAATDIYSTWQQKYTLPYGHDIFDLDISPDGKTLSAAVSDYQGNQSLLFFNLDSLNQKKVSIDTVFNFEVSSPQGFRFTDDGKYLYGSSYYSGVSNIFRVTVASKTIEPYSNSLTGLFRPIPVQDQLLAFHFTSDGFHPVYIPNKPVAGIGSIQFLGNATIEKHPVLKTWELPIAPAPLADIDSLIREKEIYRPGKLIRLNSAYPIIAGYKNFVGFGYAFNIGDPLSFRDLQFSMTYTPSTWVNGLSRETDVTSVTIDDDERLHLSFSGKVGALTFNAGYNEPNFYDLFGPTKTSRKGTTLRLSYTRSLLWSPPQRLDLTLSAGGYYGLQKSPDFQQITTQGFNKNLFLNVDGLLSYSYLRNSLGAVDPEKGIRTTLRASTTASAEKIYPRLVTTLDYGFQLPINHFSIWLRSAAGHSFSDVVNPFTRYGFAAFGNNYIDYQAARRYRNVFSFPGLSFQQDPSIIAKEFAKVMAEFVFPPIRFKNLGGINFYSNWLQATCFTSGLLTQDPFSRNNRFANVGSQVDMKVIIFSLLETTLSVGYAQAFDLNDHGKRYDEWMFSIKLLR